MSAGWDHKYLFVFTNVHYCQHILALRDEVGPDPAPSPRTPGEGVVLAYGQTSRRGGKVYSVRGK